MPVPAALTLSGARAAIDRIDDAMVALLAARRALVSTAARSKRGAGLPSRDEQRERQVMRRAHALAFRLGLPGDCATRLVTLLIAEAHHQQGLAAPSSTPTPAPGMPMPAPTDRSATAYRYLLRLIPPPHRWRPLLSLVPVQFQEAALQRVLSRAIAAPLQDRALEPVQGRRLGIEISDLGLHWVLQLRDGRLHATREPAEATVCGSATDLLLLASRLEDADTLFFQRRLMLTGDTELGLLVRNLLDRMPWETVPLGLRIILHRGGRLASEARDAYHGHA